jgi:hypothetical protein
MRADRAARMRADRAARMRADRAARMRRGNAWMRRLAIAVAVLAGCVAAGIASGHPVTGAPKCPVFPKDNPWNQRVDKLPLVKNSAAIVRSIGAGGSVHPDFGSGLYDGAPIGIPYTTVSKSQRKVRVSFDYSDESDRGRSRRVQAL